jgi:hypothetical protein
MRKIATEFDEIWKLAEERNRHEGKHRFYKIQHQQKRYITFGIYDSSKKKYVLFDTVNFVGNFRYDSKSVPNEFRQMRSLVNSY